MLQLFALAVPFYALNYIADGVANIRQNNCLFLTMNSINSGLVLVLSYIFVSGGLTGLGIAWLVAQIITVAVYGGVMRHDIPKFLRPNSKANLKDGVI